jgi:hypothetical protein
LGKTFCIFTCAEHRVVHFDDRLAGGELRVGQHVGRAVDAPAGHAVSLEQRQQPVQGSLARPLADQRVQLAWMGAPAGVVAVAGIVLQPRRAHSLAEPGEDVSPLPPIRIPSPSRVG